MVGVAKKQYLCGKETKEERLQFCLLKGQEKNFRSNEKESMKKGAVKFKNDAILWIGTCPLFGKTPRKTKFACFLFFF